GSGGSQVCSSNLAELLTTQADYNESHGRPVEPLLAQADELLRRALLTDPNDGGSHARVLDLELLRARRAVAHDRDPSPALAAARRAFRAAFAHSDNHVPQLIAVGDAEVLAARWAMKQHRSPEAFFARAQYALS